MADGDHIEIKTGDVFDSTIIGKLEIQAPKAAIHADAEASFSNRDASEFQPISPRRHREGLPAGEPKYVTRAVFNVESGYAARGLRVGVRGSKIVDATLNPEPVQMGGASSVTMQHYGRQISPTGAFLQVGAPLSHRYYVDVYTSETDDVQVGAQLA